MGHVSQPFTQRPPSGTAFQLELSEAVFSRTRCELCSTECALSPFSLCHLAEPAINLANAPEKVQGLKVCTSLTGGAAAGGITGASVYPEDQECDT